MPLRSHRVSSPRRGRRSVDKQLDDIFDTVRIIEQLAKQIYRAVKHKRTKGNIPMAKWDSMVAAVENMRGRQASNEKLFEEMNKKLQDLWANMNDEEDQKKVEEFAASFNEIAAKLPQAVEANPAPGETGGESTGHIRG